ncbi:aminotransferase, partial [Rhizobium ruizarguesonis]
LQERLTAAGMAIPMWMMADIDHGDITSADPDDYDPYVWARAVPLVSPIIHIKQCLQQRCRLDADLGVEFGGKGPVPALVHQALFDVDD